MKVKELPFINALHRFIDIKEANLRGRARKGSTTRTALYGDKSRFSELPQNVAHNDGVGVNALCEKVTRHFVLSLKHLHAGAKV